jgi:SAM-dependent methyltransferase
VGIPRNLTSPSPASCHQKAPIAVHDTAYEHGRLFFALYRSETLRTVVELGSQDVNGSLRDHCPAGVHYIGLDVMPAKGVDLVVDPDASLPLASEIADAIVTSSAFEHDVCFWDTFLELIRVLRPGGLLYLNAPANGDFHRYPLDCWRFYPDAGVAMVRWAARRGTRIELIESFIGLPQAERWADFVAVFRKTGGAPLIHQGCIADHTPSINIHRHNQPTGAPLDVETENMPDRTILEDLRVQLANAEQAHASLGADLSIIRERNAILDAELVAAQQRNDILGAELVVAQQHNEALSADLAATRQAAGAQRRRTDTAERHSSGLEVALTEANHQLAVMRNSRSWRLTSGLRRLATLLHRR